MPRPQVSGSPDSAPSACPEEASALSASALSKAAGALSDAVARLTGGRAAVDAAEDDRSGAASALSGVVSGLASAVKAGGKGALVGGGFLAELLATTATRLPLRDKATLLVQHAGLDTEELADSLTAAAARVTGTIGGAAGGLAAAQWFATPSLIAVPVELAAETLLVAAVELKLVAELHEIYDARPPGDLSERANAYLGSWTTQRGLRGEGQTVGLAARLASAGSSALRKRITGRLARNLGSFLPFLAGAVVGARNNSSGTRRLGDRLRADLAIQPQRIPSQRLGPV
ncbi:MAG: hypothetical protein M3381_09560 [Actinomycetota bacterium]|nr:hypothetical protein [Actinomycetota bacterium]